MISLHIIWIQLVVANLQWSASTLNPMLKSRYLELVRTPFDLDQWILSLNIRKQTSDYEFEAQQYHYWVSLSSYTYFIRINALPNLRFVRLLFHHKTNKNEHLCQELLIGVYPTHSQGDNMKCLRPNFRMNLLRATNGLT